MKFPSLPKNIEDFIQINFSSLPKNIEDFSNSLKLDSNVLRFLVLNKKAVSKNL